MAEKIESSREGGIDAPTRHALDWTNPDFYNQDKIDEELYRTFETVSYTHLRAHET